MRLLSFLTALEASLRAKGRIPGEEPCCRHVDYTRGSARMRIDDERALVLTLFRLASGRSCLRLSLETEDGVVHVQAFYPEVDDFSWDGANEAAVLALLPLLHRPAADSQRTATAVNA